MSDSDKTPDLAAQWHPTDPAPRRVAIPGFNDLATVNPDLAAQWHPTKNGDLAPQDVVAGYTRSVWWLGECGHEWEASISKRSNGLGCPYCSGHSLLQGFNDLATTRPDLASQWHPSKNGTLTPQDVKKGSNRKVWWLGECGHEWEARIDTRATGRSCPFCSGKKVLPGFNDLATVNPDLAAQWHPTRNGDLSPESVTARSNKRVWWRCDKGHVWETDIASRSYGAGCPVCARNARKKRGGQR